MAGLGGIGNSWVTGMIILIVICFVLMCYLYAIEEKVRVYVADKMNVEFWGLFFILMKM